MNKIAEIIQEKFSYAYCNNCDGNLESDKCEECHRKNINWACSDEYAEKTANAIVEELRKEIPDEFINRVVGPF